MSLFRWGLLVGIGVTLVSEIAVGLLFGVVVDAVNARIALRRPE